MGRGVLGIISMGSPEKGWLVVLLLLLLSARESLMMMNRVKNVMYDAVVRTSDSNQVVLLDEVRF